MTSAAHDDSLPGTPSHAPGRPTPFPCPWWASVPFIGVAAGALMAVRLFLPGPIGLADNGDGPRRMCALGVVAQVPPGVTPWVNFVHFGYTRANPGACDPSTVYPGSGRWLLRLAHPVSHWLGFSAEFDLRTLAVLFCLVVGFAFAVFSAALRRGPVSRLLICLLLFMVVGDATFAGYAASPYSEAVGLMGILVATAAAVHFGGSTPARLGGLLLFTLGAVVAVTAKIQAVTLAVPFLVLLLVTRVPVGRLRGALASRVLPLLAAAAIAWSAVFTAQSQPQDFREINPTEVVFVNLLGKSHDPAAAAVELGLPADFARYAGHSWWDVRPDRDPRWPQVRSRMTYGNIAGFLVHHPGIAASIAAGAASDFGVADLGYLGSYPVTAGEPAGAHESRMAFYSDALHESGGGLALAAVLGLGVAGVWWFRSPGQDPRRRAFVAAMLCMVGVTFAQFLTAAYGEAIENTKHLVFAILAAGLAFVLTVGAAFCAPWETDEVDGTLPAPREADGPAEQQAGSPGPLSAAES